MIQNHHFPEIHGNFGFGCMRLPMKGEQVDLEQFTQMVDIFLDAGFNYFDTAHGYLGTQSETALRECLVKRYPRDRFILTDKLSTHFFKKEEEVRPLLDLELEACGVEYFDFLLMHAQDAAIYEKYLRCKAYEQSLAFVAEGKAKHFGISFHDKAEVLDRILTDWPQIELVQIQLNYVDWEDASVESKKVHDVCAKHGKPVAVMEPVKGGSLVNLPEEAQGYLTELNRERGTEHSNASYALRFAGSQPQVAVVLSGMSDLNQVKENTKEMADFSPLDKQEQAAIRKVTEVFKGMNMIPCTGCRYCVLDNDCPKKILIPDLFSCYNLKITFHNWNQDYYYSNILTRDNGKASDCIRCGKCEKICPQHLPIRSLLQDVAREFEQL